MRLPGKVGWLVGVATVALLAVHVSDRARSKKIRVLPLEIAPGQSASHPMTGGERHEHVFLSAPDRYLRVTVEQLGVDVTVSLVGPDGEELIRADSWIGRHGPEVVEAVVERSGGYRLRIRPGSDSAPAGRYELQFEAHRPATALDRHRDVAARAFSEAAILRRRGDPESLHAALDRYRTAAEHWGRAGDTVRQAVALGQLGRLARRDDPGEAKRWYELSAERFRESGERGREVLIILNQLGKLLIDLGEFQRALEPCEEAVTLARHLGDGLQEAAGLNNLATAHRNLGHLKRAVGHYEEAVARLSQLDAPAAEAATLSNVARFFISLGDLDRAEELLTRALRLSTGVGNARAEARARRTLAALQRRQGRLEESRASLRRALALDRELGDRSGRAASLRGLGRTLYELGEYEESAATLVQALGLTRDLGDARQTANVLFDLGQVALARAEPREALERYEQALAVFRRIENRTGEASTLYGAARAERRRGELAAARSRIEEALEVVETLRARTDVMDLRASYYAGKQDYYELYIDLLVELHQRDPSSGHDGRALEVSERRRARVLLDVLHQALEVGLDEDPSDILLPARTPRIAVGSEEAPALRLPEIQALLDEDTILLEYSLGAARSFLWRVTSTELELHELPGKHRIDVVAREAYRRLTRSHGRRGRVRLGMALEELSRVLLGPVADRLGAKRLVVVGEESLQYIPYGALPAPYGVAAEPLVRRHEIVYLPALSTLAALRRETATRARASGRVAVIADPVFNTCDPRAAGECENGDDPRLLDRLSSAREEAAAILAMVPEGQGLGLLGYDASRTRVLESGQLTSYRFVHFATHGWFDPAAPELSGLILSRLDEQGRRQDGFLSAPEIYRGLKLPVEMVTLSACRTGLGKEMRGEGLVGLTQSFLYAGAARVIVSFWEVDDTATAELMTRLYRGILEHGLRPAEALTEAQRAMLEDPRWEAPYYWAGFFLQGEWR